MPTVHQRHRQTEDGRTTYDSNTAPALRASRGKNVYNVQICSFYHIKWRHLANFLLLDNVIDLLKLRRFTYYTLNNTDLRPSK